MALAELVDGRIVLSASYRELELCKQVPGARWRDDAWSLPVSWPGCLALRGIFGAALDIGPGLNEWARLQRLSRIEPAMQLRAAPKFPFEDDGGVPIGYERLFPWQRAAAEFLVQAQQALLASEMGTGKTPTTISALKRLVAIGVNPFPVLIVATNSMKGTWEAEFAAWAPELSVAVVQGTRAQRAAAITSGADVVIINWEALRTFSRIAGYGSIHLSDKDRELKELNHVKWTTIVADEAHKAKAPDALQTRALWWLGKEARFRYALTGTPVANRPDDLWSILHFLEPDEWPSRIQFIDRYCDTSFSVFGTLEVTGIKPHVRDEFFSAIDPRMRRDLLANVWKDRPPVMQSMRLLEMDTKQERAYRAMQKESLVGFDDGGIIAATNPLEKALRLWQLASGLLTDSEEGWDFIEPSNKLDALLDILAEAAGKPVIAFAQSRRLIEMVERRIKKEGIDYTIVTGKVSEEERTAAVARFQTGQVPLFLGTFGAGSEGLTLTAAYTQVNLQLAASRVQAIQANGRANRIGLDHPLDIIDLVTRGSVEEWRLLQAADKDFRAEQVCRDKEALAFGLKQAATPRRRAT